MSATLFLPIGHFLTLFRAENFGQSELIYVKVGLPMGVFFGVQTDGVFQNQTEIDSYTNSTGGKIQPNAKPGDLKFIDENGDGTISDGDRVQIGSPLPDFTGGLNLNAEIYGFDFNMFLYAALGQEVYSATRRYDMNFANYTAEWLDRWTGEGTSDKYPRVTFADNNLNGKTIHEKDITDQYDIEEMKDFINEYYSSFVGGLAKDPN